MARVWSRTVIGSRSAAALRRSLWPPNESHPPDAPEASSPLLEALLVIPGRPSGVRLNILCVCASSSPWPSCAFRQGRPRPRCTLPGRHGLRTRRSRARVPQSLVRGTGSATALLSHRTRAYLVAPRTPAVQQPRQASATWSTSSSPSRGLLTGVFATIQLNNLAHRGSAADGGSSCCRAAPRGRHPLLRSLTRRRRPVDTQWHTRGCS